MFKAEQQAGLFPYKEGKVCFMQKKRKMTLERRHNLTGWAFLSIGVVLICWTSFYPMIQAFILSLKSGLGVNLKFNGFSNYARILKDPTFKGTLFNTFFYLIIQVPIMLTLALILASIGQWQELYGRRVTLTFGLDLYGESAGELQTAYDRMAEAFQWEGPAGLALRELSCGETEFDRAAGLYRRAVTAVCQGYLYAVADKGGTFLDFVVRGEGHL